MAFRKPNRWGGNSAGSGIRPQDVTVNNAGTTLGGTDTIGGRAIVNHDANLAPGNGLHTTGILTVGLLTLQPFSNFSIDINGTTAGTGYDQLQVSGAGGSAGAVIDNSDLLVHVGTTLTVGDQFTIAHHNLGFGGEFNQRGIVVADNGQVFTIDYTVDGDIILTLVGAPVPEPSTWVGGVLAIAGIAFTQRRKLRKLNNAALYGWLLKRRRPIASPRFCTRSSFCVTWKKVGAVHLNRLRAIEVNCPYL